MWKQIMLAAPEGVVETKWRDVRLGLFGKGG